MSKSKLMGDFEKEGINMIIDWINLDENLNMGLENEKQTSDRADDEVDRAMFDVGGLGEGGFDDGGFDDGGFDNGGFGEGGFGEGEFDDGRVGGEFGGEFDHFNDDIHDDVEINEPKGMTNKIIDPNMYRCDGLDSRLENNPI